MTRKINMTARSGFKVKTYMRMRRDGIIYYGKLKWIELYDALWNAQNAEQRKCRFAIFAETDGRYTLRLKCNKQIRFTWTWSELEKLFKLSPAFVKGTVASMPIPQDIVIPKESV